MTNLLSVHGFFISSLGISQQGLSGRENTDVKVVSSMRSNWGGSLKLCVCRCEMWLVRSCHAAGGWRTSSNGTASLQGQATAWTSWAVSKETPVFLAKVWDNRPMLNRRQTWGLGMRHLGERASEGVWLCWAQQEPSAISLVWGGRSVGHQHKDSTCVFLHGWDYRCV